MIEQLTSFYLIPLLFFTGLIAGAVDAIAGGGGLISLPMLLSVGIPPHIALGTNKFQTTIGTSIATYSYYKQGWISFKTVYKGLLFGLIGAVLGATASQTISSDILNKLIPLLLLIILIYTFFTPKMGQAERPAKMRESLFFALFGFLLGFYDGFFGPGTGSLWVFALTFFLGYNFTNATAYTKVFNLKSNIFATACFLFGGAIDYRIAICMAAGQIIGGRIGAKLAIKRGANLIRPVFLIMVTATICVLTYRNYSNLSRNNILLYLNYYPQFLALMIIVFVVLYFTYARKAIIKSLPTK